MSLVPDPDNIRLALLGSSAGNGHPYSWGAIFNGYDRKLMTSECPFPGIPEYLNQQPAESFPLSFARVTHVHCVGDGGFSAEHVAACSHIPFVVSRPEDVIGLVDAVIVATDRGSEHVERCRPFVEAGLPIFVDKPLVTEVEDLRIFDRWIKQGASIMSSSAMRYAKEFLPYQLPNSILGELRFVNVVAAKSWESYGIHALESVFPILGPGFETVRSLGNGRQTLMHLTHKSGTEVVAALSPDTVSSFGSMQLSGSDGIAQLRFVDTFHAFRAQMIDFVEFLRSGVRPFPFEDTVELMKLLIGGIKSRELNGAVVHVDDIRY